MVKTGMALIRAQRGLLAKVARDLGVTRPAVTTWTRVPAERIPEVEASTGIPRHLLRPDICLPPCGCLSRRAA
jgi:DNA-binding transcriptional regulator YdaS (Cro superfamily)